MSVRSFLISTTCLLGLALGASACALPSVEELQAPAGDPQATWAPSDEWRMLYDWDRELRDLRAAALAEEDRDRQLEQMDVYRAERAELEQYFIDNPSADAPCDTLNIYAPPQLWCSNRTQ